jgi:adenylate cyclase
VERKLTAILCADVYGYSRLMGEDEEATLRTLTSHRKLIDSQIEQHHGRFVNSAGDSVLAEFASVVEAVNCAVDIQTRLKAENASISPERRMEFRIGVNLGDVMVEGTQIYGDGVNVAARLESLAEPGGICISNTVHDQVSTKLALAYADLGEQAVKNIAKPVRVFRVLLNGAPAVLPLGTQLIPRKYVRRGVLTLTGVAIVIAMIVLVQHVSLKPPRTSASIPPEEKPALPLPDMPSIAVLPFTNQSSDPQEEYFSDGISDQLISDLSRLPGLFVIARTSSFTYKNKAARAQDIGREFGVKYVLEGSVRKAPDRVRIGVELVDAGSGTEMWTQRFDRPLKDIFALQDEIVAKVVTTLGLIIKLDRTKHWEGGAPRSNNLEAFDDYLRAAEYYWRMTKNDNKRARQWLEKAIELDPNFAGAYAFLGGICGIDAVNGWSQNPQADKERSSELVQKALALDDSNSLALAMLSYVDWMQRRFDQAVAEGERAVAINPNSAQGYQSLADALNVSGKPQEAIRAAEKAIRLDPAHRDFYAYDIGLAYLEMGRYQEAIPIYERVLATSPNYLYAHLDLVIAYEELGRHQDARAEAAAVMRISPQLVLPPPEKSLLKDVALNKRFDSDLHKAGLK